MSLAYAGFNQHLVKPGISPKKGKAERNFGPVVSGGAIKNRRTYSVRTKGAGGKKLGPVYPMKHVNSASKEAVGTNIRHFYKTKGLPIKQAVAISLSIQKRAAAKKR